MKIKPGNLYYSKSQYFLVFTIQKSTGHCLNYGSSMWKCLILGYDAYGHKSEMIKFYPIHQLQVDDICVGLEYIKDA